MKTQETYIQEKVSVSPEWWRSVQADLQEAIAQCNDITSAIAAHQINGKYDAEDLLEQIDGQIRTVRRLVEQMVTPI